MTAHVAVTRAANVASASAAPPARVPAPASEPLRKSSQQDFSRVRIHTMAHGIQRQAEPYITKITVDLTPKEKATLTWSGTPPASAPGGDDFTVSTGKGYAPKGEGCTRNCCTDPDTQCAAPWNEPGKVGACCTPVGTDFYTGVPRTKHNGWNWWTPVEPVHTKLNRGIALHQHTIVTGDPIGHGCIRMADENAHRIFLYSRGAKTNVTITGVAKPVECTDAQRCAGAAKPGEATGQADQPSTAQEATASVGGTPDAESPSPGSESAQAEEVAV